MLFLKKIQSACWRFHTVSQLGFVLAAPEVGGFYALTHGLVKSSLFLISGNLPSRNFKELKQTPIPTSLWIALAIASFSHLWISAVIGFRGKGADHEKSICPGK